MRSILASSKENCCGNLDIFLPCQREELAYLVQFLYDGKISCKNPSTSSEFYDNLTQVLGFPLGITLNQTQISIFESTNMPGKIDGQSISYNDSTSALEYEFKPNFKREIDMDGYEGNYDITNYAQTEMNSNHKGKIFSNFSH
jgi:hypothetical protein